MPSAFGSCFRYRVNSLAVACPLVSNIDHAEIIEQARHIDIQLAFQHVGFHADVRHKVNEFAGGPRPLAAPGHEPGDFQNERLHGFLDDGLLRPRQFPDATFQMERKGEFLVLLVPPNDLHGGGRWVGALFLLQDKSPIRCP